MRGHRAVCPPANPRGLPERELWESSTPVPQRGRPLCPTVQREEASGGRGETP